MGRPRRIDRVGGWYHVMNRGAARAPTFVDDVDRVEFGRLLGVVHGRFGVVVHAYCLMSNHYHLVLECPDGGLSDAMRDLGSVFTRHFNDRHGRDGPIFRGRFHSIDVHTDSYLRCAVRYVHRNALDLPGVGAVDRYRWSSHRTYLGHRRPAPWLETKTVLALFGGDPARFHAFVAGAPSSPCDVEALGDLAAHDVDAVLQLAIAHAQLKAERSTDDSPAAMQQLVHTVRVLLLDAPEWPGRDALADRAGDISRFARRRARARLASDPMVANALAFALSLLHGEDHRAVCA